MGRLAGKTTPGAAFLALLNRTTSLSHSSQTRAVSRAERVAKIKPMTAAAAFGGLLGLAIGCAYLGGTAARATTLEECADLMRQSFARSAPFLIELMI